MSREKTPSRCDRRTRRPAPNREEKPHVLIVEEGEKTEFSYFKDFRNEGLRIGQKTLVIRGAKQTGHTDPLGIVKDAIQIVAEALVKNDPFEKVWCVFDLDYRPRKNLQEAIALAKANGFSLATSNPTFELWYLLHFEENPSTAERKSAEVVRLLKKRIPGYTKAMDGVYKNLADYQGKAIKNAKSLRKQHKDNKKAEDANPSTSVDKLIRDLKTRYKR